MNNTPSTKQYDAIVIGAGHNGLVCATYLARAGKRVLVLEARDEVGGAAATREFAPGFRVSAGAHLLHLMPAALINDLRLAQHGLAFARQQLPTTALSTDGRPLPIGAAGLNELAQRSARDAAAYPAFTARLHRFARVLFTLLDGAPPRLGTDAWSDRLALVKLGLRVRLLGRRDMREFLRIIGMNAHDLFSDEFETPLLKGALGFDAVLGTNFGPRAPGTVLTLLYRLAAESAAGPHPLAQPVGGLGALSAALGRAAAAAGAEVRTSARVSRITVREDRAVGVELESGERIEAQSIISNADAKNTFLRLLGPRHLDTGFVRKVDHLRSNGLAAKLHLALDRKPEFTGLREDAAGGRLLIAPTLEYLEKAWNHSKYGECSSAPGMEITVPTIHDGTLAPSGKHVLSAIVQYAPHTPRAGWDAERPRFLEAVLSTLEAHAPGIRGTITAAELSTPADLEREFGMWGGHWHHGELAFDQFYMVRPVPGAAQHRTPIDGLYLCGASCHPGGGVMGLAGRNVARALLNGAR
jgi:phytoene dehydrogenase-like protein